MLTRTWLELPKNSHFLKSKIFSRSNIDHLIQNTVHFYGPEVSFLIKYDRKMWNKNPDLVLGVCLFPKIIQIYLSPIQLIKLLTNKIKRHSIFSSCLLTDKHGNLETNSWKIKVCIIWNNNTHQVITKYLYFNILIT